MSRTSYPRVAPRTRRRQLRIPKLSPLKVAIYDRGVLSVIKEFPDPRIAFCEGMNRDYGPLGLTARPITDESEVRHA